jgi:DNA-binding CsgD family transcriptional regulator
VPWAVLDRLLELIPCRHVGFSELDHVQRQPVTLEHVKEGGERSIACGFTTVQELPYPQYWTHRGQFGPNRYMQRTGDLVSVLRWSDFYSTSAMKNAPYYAEYLRPMGDLHALIVPLPAEPGRRRQLSLDRDSGPDFGENDRLVLQLLRPHLHEVYLDAERRRHGTPHLSRREREILRLVSQGYSNADIARILFISVATVRKHMEHIFDRTGVRTRTAAAALALPSDLRPLPARPPESYRRHEATD